MKLQTGFEDSARVLRTDQSDRSNQLQVGEEWPDGIEVQVHEAPQEKTRLVSGVFIFFAVLLTGFAIYGMAVSDEEILADVFRLVQYGTIASVSYALGRSPPHLGT